MTEDGILRGELRDQLVAAMQRVPELAGRELTLTALSGGITNRNFLVTIAGAADRFVIRLAGKDTHLLGSVGRSNSPRPSRPRGSASGRRSRRSSVPRVIS